MTKIKNILPTIFEDVKLFEMESFDDNRGSFKEIYNKEIQSIIGEDINFIQDNESVSSYGVLRGLHYQKYPYEQSKLIRVSFGEIQDVVVDLREGSKAYGRWEVYNISSNNNRVLFVPKGFAHGFLALSNETVVNYKVDSKHSPEHESGIRYDDKNLGVTWNLSNEDIIVSDRDKELPNFQKSFVIVFLYIDCFKYL